MEQSIGIPCGVICVCAEGLGLSWHPWVGVGTGPPQALLQQSSTLLRKAALASNSWCTFVFIFWRPT